MKPVLRLVILYCLFCAGLLTAYGQITFTATDVAASLAPGVIETDHSDTATQTAEIGTPGATSWDFSGLQSNTTSTNVGALPDSTPFFNIFPGATHVQVSVIQGGKSYAYFKLGTNLLGLGAVYTGSTTERVSVNPPAELIQLPLTYGTHWTTTYADSGKGGVTQHSDTYTVDAYGSLKLPGGLVSQALRVRVEQRSETGFLEQITYGIKARNGMSVNIYVIDTTQPNSGTINVAGFTWNGPIASAAGLTVTSPGSLETVVAGEQYLIQWQGTGVDSLKIDLSLDSGNTYANIAPFVQAAQNQYLWDVPDTLSAKCRIRLTDLADTTATSVSSQFRIKPYILTRFKPNGDYEPFDPKIHGWQFANEDTNMWPQEWWQQYHYTGGTDPNTAQPYDTLFKGIRSFAFPDWPLFVNAFGFDSCYLSSSPVIYSQRAYWYWRSIIKPWRGSCFGFSISSLIDFDFPTAFNAFYPQLGNFSQLNDLSINDTTRLVVNLYKQYWFGEANLQYFHTQWYKTPVQTLQDIKMRFLSDIRNDQSLYLYNGGPGGGAHSIVPYTIQRSSDSIKILVYDNNCPGGDCGNGVTNPAVIIDSVNNRWSYPPLDWPSGGFAGILYGSKGLFLETPVNTFLNRPIFPSALFQRQGIRTIAPFQVGSASVMVFNTATAAIAIVDSASDTIGFHDSTTVNSFTVGIPLVPGTSHFEPPVGYMIPNGNYSIKLSSFQDTSAKVTIFDTLRVFTYWREDATPTQTDRFSYHNGLAVGNPDPQTKNVNLEAVLTLPANERVWRVSNAGLAQSDSVQISLPDTGEMKLINLGSQKSYDLYVQTGGTGKNGKFNHTGVTVPANSTHFIRPNWPDLQQSLKILEDVGNTGTITDSIIVSNQTLGVKESPKQGLPTTFALEQNYPNPFNPSTSIRYSLPKEAHVTLTIFNVLGQEVATIVNETEQPGYKTVEFNAAHLPSGIYFYRLNAGEYSATKKFVVMK